MDTVEKLIGKFFFIIDLLASRSLIRHRFKTRQRTITWQQLLEGHWVPWLGAVLTAWDISVITKNILYRYKLITGIGV
ncbi:hypothetical protein [Rosenbergiella australiborealis]|uniref:hypothetical protein n=1 Tax=Rosenbergiella australiborealis TaxID=1544696 RepID=UPI001F4E2749|nr:hypothetical protein [Rosenbergiella australiborealis]